MYSIILALLPVIMIYRVPGSHFGVGTLSILLLAVASLIVILKNRYVKLNCLLFLFLTYLIARNIGDGFTPVLYTLSFLIVIACYNGHLDFELVAKTIETISIIASMAVLIQTIMHYIFGINIAFLYSPTLLSEYASATGYSLKSGLFRPSAFFLEPAHFCQYTIIALFTLLEKRDTSTNKIISICLVTAGILCTTSGIGILLCIGIYAYYLGRIILQKKGINKLLYFVVLGVFAILVLLIASRIPLIQNTWQRVFGNDVGEYNAVRGRSVHWEDTVGSLQGMQALWGVGPKNNRIAGFITGANEIIYYYGYFGLGLLVLSLIALIFKSTKEDIDSMKWTIILCGIYFALFWASDIVGFISIAFWFSVLVCDKSTYIEKKWRYCNENLDDSNIFST